MRDALELTRDDERRLERAVHDLVVLTPGWLAAFSRGPSESGTRLATGVWLRRVHDPASRTTTVYHDQVRVATIRWKSRA